MADLGIEFRVPYTAVLDTSRGPEWATWFTGGEFALTDSCLRRWAAERPAEPAVIGVDESGLETALSWAGLSLLTRQIAAELRRDGVRPGDAVAVFLPMTGEYVATLYACAQLGAMALPLFTGFGADAIAAGCATRARGCGHHGRHGPARPVEPLAPVLAEASTGASAGGDQLRTVLVVGEPGPAPASSPAQDRPGWRTWEPDPQAAAPADANGPCPAFPSEQPFLLAYTSGTTGSPKGAVLTQAGLLLGVARDAAYHVDLRRGDVLCWPADPGWIMGPWQIVAAGAVGATLCCSRACPATPPRTGSGRSSTRHHVAVFGCGPTLARSLARAGSAPPPGSWPSLRRSPAPANRPTRVLGLPVPCHRRAPRPGDQHLRRHRGGRRVPGPAPGATAQAAARSAAPRWAWTSTSSTARASRRPGWPGSWSAGDHGRR